MATTRRRTNKHKVVTEGQWSDVWGDQQPEPKTPKGIVRKALARWIATTAFIVGQTYWLTIRGDCELGLCMSSMLTVEEYSAVLFVAGLVTVSVNTTKDSGYEAKTSHNRLWKTFLEANKLDRTNANLAEATRSQVKVGAFKRKHKGTPIGNSKQDLHLIRIGRYKDGEAIVASKQLTDGVAPPNFQRTRKLRAAQKRLLAEVSPIIQPIISFEESDDAKKISVIADWVRMEELNDSIDSSKSKFKSKSKVGKSEAPSDGNNDDAAPQDGSRQAKSNTDGCDTYNSTKKTSAPDGASITVSASTMNTIRIQNSVLCCENEVLGTENEELFDENKKLRSLNETLLAEIDELKKPKQWYPEGHPNFKHRLLNMLPINVMVRDGGPAEYFARQNMDGLFRQACQFNANNNADIRFESWTAKLNYHILQVPVAEDNDEFIRKAKEDRWIEEMLVKAVKDGELEEGIECMLEYLIKHHKETTQGILVKLGLSPQQMTAFDIAAAMQATNTGIGIWRKFVLCFQVYTGLKREMFTVSEAAWRRLGIGHGFIKNGTWSYDKKDGKRPEKVSWWTMDAAEELELRCTDFANIGDDFCPQDIEYIHSIYTGDHGKGKFRMGAKLVIGLKGKKKAVAVYPLADVKCKKDTGEVFKETVHENLAAGINKVEHGRVKFEKNDDGKWKASIIDQDHVDFNGDDTVDTTAFMIGDLKFLSMILGKENFDGLWCYLCSLYYDDWQKDGHECGTPWTLDRLKAQVLLSKDLDGKERMGVREDPYFEIPVERFIWPILHTLIGIGNAILKNLIDVIENEIQSLTPRELKLKREVRELVDKLKLLMDEKDEWDSSNENSGSQELKEYKRLLAVSKKKMKNMEDYETFVDENGENDQEYADENLHLLDCLDRIKNLEEERREMARVLKEKRKVKSSKLKILGEFKKDRKTDHDSLYTKIDSILERFGILRAAYHGGDLTGVCVIHLMTHADEIMDEVATLLKSNKGDECVIDDYNIDKLCNNSRDVLTLWDGALAGLHVEFPEEEDYTKTQSFIDAALKLAREMEMTVTPKGHGGEKHLVAQMRVTRGGLFEFDESWGEQYHQTGYNFDMRLRGQGSEVRKAMVRATANRREGLAGTRESILLLQKNKTGKRGRTIEKEQKVKQESKKRREDALEKYQT